MVKRERGWLRQKCCEGSVGRVSLVAVLQGSSPSVDHIARTEARARCAAALVFVVPVHRCSNPLCYSFVHHLLVPACLQRVVVAVMHAAAPLSCSTRRGDADAANVFVCGVRRGPRRSTPQLQVNSFNSRGKSSRVIFPAHFEC